MAKEIYGTDQTGLGYMVAGAAFGALLGSIALSRFGTAIRPARTMIVAASSGTRAARLSRTCHRAAGIAVALPRGRRAEHEPGADGGVLLRTSDEQFRGRVMGIRMLAIYGNFRAADRRAADPEDRLSAHRDALLRPGPAVHAADRGALAGQLWRRDAPANRR